MSKRTYTPYDCWLCRQVIPGNGLSKYQHNMKHVRKGEMTRRRDTEGYWVFERAPKPNKSEG